MTIHSGASEVNSHGTPAAKTILSLSEGLGQKALTVDVHEPGEVNVALDMAQYAFTDETGAIVMAGGHRCGAFSVEDAIAFRDALTEAIDFSVAQVAYGADG